MRKVFTLFAVLLAVFVFAAPSAMAQGANNGQYVDNDYDDDGIINCLDDDIDGDGIPNDEDDDDCLINQYGFGQNASAAGDLLGVSADAYDGGFLGTYMRLLMSFLGK